MNVSNQFTIDATARSGSGKGASRRDRAAGGVPAIVYGPGQSSLAVVVSPKELTKALTGPLKRNQLLTLNVKDGDKKGARTVMVKEIQNHPVKRVPTHVDFLEVKPDQAVPVKVPLEAVGKSKAIVQGAKLTLLSRTVTLEAPANAVPEKVVFDVTNEGFGVIRAKALKVPEGTKLLDGPETPLVSLKVPRGDKEEEAAAAASAAGAAPAAGAASAAAGKAPAAAAPAGDKKK